MCKPSRDTKLIERRDSYLPLLEQVQWLLSDQDGIAKVLEVIDAYVPVHQVYRLKQQTRTLCSSRAYTTNLQI